jgi:hypothetical protein
MMIPPNSHSSSTRPQGCYGSFSTRCSRQASQSSIRADKFQSPAVKDKILDALVHSPLVGKDPKRYFFLAARMDRPSLARRAAEQMNDPIEDWTAEDVNEAGGRYFLALLWSAMRQEMLGVHYHGPPRWVTDPWAKVGDSLDRHLR